VTKLNPPPAPTTLTWIVDRRPTAADGFEGRHVEVLCDGWIGITDWKNAATGAYRCRPWAHCPDWSEPEVLVPDSDQLETWTREFAQGNAKGREDCASIVDFIAKHTAHWIAAQRKRAQ
jgi:hypothetical protein